LPYVDSLEILRITDESTIQAAFRTKRLVAHELLKPDLDNFKKQYSDLETVQWRETGAIAGNSLILAADVKPTDDIRVRQAVSKAVDRQALIDTAQYGQGWYGGTLVAVNNIQDLLSEDELKKLLARDLTAAKQLYQAAGVGNWTPKITGQGGNSTVAELVQAQLKDLGITNTTVDGLDNVAVTNFFTNHDRDFVAYLRGARVFGVNADLFSSYKTKGDRNVARMSDAQIDQMIDAQAAELKDRQKRRDILQSIQRRLIDLAAVTPLYSKITLIAHWPYVMNYIMPDAPPEPGWYEQIWLNQ
jgi:peptide/nickel transport system substrate-binding protein